MMKTFLKKIIEYFLSLKRKPYINQLKTVIDSDTTIISTNCFAGRIMQDLNMEYNSPTVGLYFMYPDYISFLSDLRFYLGAELRFVDKSKYPQCNERRKKWPHWYPIGVLADRIEVHFLHYKSEEEAAEKWKRRCARVNYNKLLIIGMEQNECCVNDIISFDKLPYERKFMFSSKELPYVKSNICVTEFLKNGKVGDPYKKGHIFYKYLCKGIIANTQF